MLKDLMAMESAFGLHAGSLSLHCRINGSNGDPESGNRSPEVTRRFISHYRLNVLFRVLRVGAVPASKG
jgi:hypothetical protein